MHTIKRKIFPYCLKLLELILALLLLSSLMTYTTLAAETGTTLSLPNGKKMTVKQFDGENYISLYALSLSLGGSGSFNGQTLTVFVNCIGHSLSAKSGAAFLTADGKTIPGRKNLISSNVLYVPLSSAAVGLGYNLEGQSPNLSLKKDTPSLNSGNSDSSGKPDSSQKQLDEQCVLWLARIIYCESRGQPYEGQLAVGTVVMNRVASKEFPNTIYSVIFDKKYGVQFTPAGNGSVWCTPDQTAIRAAKEVLLGYRTDKKILYFMNPKLATSTWISRNRTYAFTIGDHDFYY